MGHPWLSTDCKIHTQHISIYNFDGSMGVAVHLFLAWALVVVCSARNCVAGSEAAKLFFPIRMVLAIAIFARLPANHSWQICICYGDSWNPLAAAAHWLGLVPPACRHLPEPTGKKPPDRELRSQSLCADTVHLITQKLYGDLPSIEQHKSNLLFTWQSVFGAWLCRIMKFAWSGCQDKNVLTQ
jgi:hypothetical protein